MGVRRVMMNNFVWKEIFRTCVGHNAGIPYLMLRGCAPWYLLAELDGVCPALQGAGQPPRAPSDPPEQAMKRIRGLECLSYKGWEIWGSAQRKERRERNFLQGKTAAGQRTMNLSRQRTVLDDILGRNSSLRGRWGTGMHYTEKLWMPHPWKCSRPGWMGLWARWFSRKSLPMVGAWN